MINGDKLHSFSVFVEKRKNPRRRSLFRSIKTPSELLITNDSDPNLEGKKGSLEKSNLTREPKTKGRKIPVNRKQRLAPKAVRWHRRFYPFKRNPFDGNHSSSQLISETISSPGLGLPRLFPSTLLGKR